MEHSIKPTILAVDDEAVILNSILAILKAEYTVKPFTSGRAALKYLEKNSVHLILLDYHMPEMSGSEILECLRSTNADTPVIFLTGSSDHTTEVEVLEKGAADYIHKPINSQVLRTRIGMQIELQTYKNQMERLVAEKTRELSAAYSKIKRREKVTTVLLATVTDMRDHETGRHIERTTELTRVLVEDLLQTPRTGYFLGESQAEDIIGAAKLHDVGKIGIPDGIILKKGKLTPEEFAVIQKHPLYGAELLQSMTELTEDDPFWKTALHIVVGHHEKWDGSGYPYGLKGQDIPLSARIVALADVYDALTSSRPYKASFSHEQSLEIIENNSGKHFDPQLVSIFIDHAGKFRKISLSR